MLMQDCQTVKLIADKLSLTSFKIDPLNCCDNILTYCEGNRVTRLNWDEVGLSGEIPEEIGLLTELTLIRFNTNKLTGGFPASMRNLTKLGAISVGSNQMTGPLPEFFGSLPNLGFLRLGENRFTGTIPTSWGNLRQTVFLSIYDNQLEGKIPEEIGKLRNMGTLELSGNAFWGHLPAGFENMTRIDYLRFENTNITGPLPRSWANLTINKCPPGINPFGKTCCQLPVGVCAPAGVVYPEQCGTPRVCTDSDYLEPQPPVTAVPVVPQAQTSSSAMSIGVIIGIVAASLFVVLALFLVMRNRKKPQNIEDPILPELQELLIPSKLVTVETEIARGSYSVVFRGTFNAEQVAIKQLNQFVPTRSMLKEIKIMKDVMHSRIVPMYGVIESEGIYSLVMELMDNRSLMEYIAEKDALPLPVQLTIAGDVASAMAYLARKHIIHRDLKTSNILLDAQCRAKVTDFGLSIVRETSMTVAESQAAGTVHYMAPECFGLSPKYSEKSDMFAYSVVLWELFTWQQPYKNVTPEEIQNSILNGERMDVPSSVPDAIRDLIQLGWHQDYKERPHFRDCNLLFSPMNSEEESANQVSEGETIASSSTQNLHDAFRQLINSQQKPQNSLESNQASVHQNPFSPSALERKLLEMQDRSDLASSSYKSSQ